MGCERGGSGGMEGEEVVCECRVGGRGGRGVVVVVEDGWFGGTFIIDNSWLEGSFVAVCDGFASPHADLQEQDLN